MRTIAEIKDTITTAFISDENIIALYGLDTEKKFSEQFSPVSFESIFFGVIAMVIHLHEAIFDTHKNEVQSLIDEKEPHSLRWYRNLALNFRYGHALLPDSDKYSEEAIDDESAAIIKYAAVTKKGNILYMKVAKDGIGGLAALNETEKSAFLEYIERTMDAGVIIIIVSQAADYLKLVVDIWYDPQVLDGDGVNLLGAGDTTVQDAITTYLQNLKFDGTFTITALTDALQLVDGVEIPRVLSAQSKWGASEWNEITSKYNPEAGWLQIYDEEDLVINWHANISD